jgi:putative addiction module component (TIGR02574 family)
MTHEDLAKLSAAERIALIGDIWDSIPDADAPLPQAQSEELLRRLTTFDDEKTKAVSWESIKADLSARKR